MSHFLRNGIHCHLESCAEDNERITLAPEGNVSRDAIHAAQLLLDVSDDGKLRNYFKFKKGSKLYGSETLNNETYVFNCTSSLWQNDPENTVKESAARQFLISLTGYVSSIEFNIIR
jgi:hypothetical protein